MLYELIEGSMAALLAIHCFRPWKSKVFGYFWGAMAIGHAIFFFVSVPR